MPEIPRLTPVLVGVGVVSQREDDALAAREPIALMIEAARRAGADSGAPALLGDVGRITVPKGRWDYADPAGTVAAAIGAPRATSVLARVGVLQQSPIGDSCRRIAEGELDAALVVGGEAGYRLLRARIAGAELSDTPSQGEPDEVLAPADELRHPVELRAGLQMPIGIYAMIESAFRTRLGRGFDEHLDAIARIYARFSEIAAANPDAWRQEALPAEAIRTPSERNPMQAFPYTRAHCSSWSVDQAAALLLCSAEKASEAGVPRERWVFPLASAESNHMRWACARRELAALPGARLAGKAALEHAGLTGETVDLIDMYCPFPIAVELYALEAGIPLERDLTVTGGMPFAGGPYNNYVFQATAKLAQLLRAGAGTTGLISNASGVLTKQAFGVWSREPGERPFGFYDVSSQVERELAAKPVREDYAGGGVVVGNTVLHDRGRPPRGVAILDVDDDARTVAITEDPALIATLEQAEFNGTEVTVREGVFHV